MNNITSFLHKIINQIIRKKKNDPFYDYPFGRKPHATKEEYLIMLTIDHFDLLIYYLNIYILITH